VKKGATSAGRRAFAGAPGSVVLAITCLRGLPHIDSEEAGGDFNHGTVVSEKIRRTLVVVIEVAD
jgi:hypothetical protein